MIDGKSSKYPQLTLTAAVRTGDVSGAAVDRTLYDAKEITHILLMGAGGITFDDTNKIEVVMEESDNNSDYTAVAQKDCIVDNGVTVTSGIVKAFVAAHATATAYSYGYRGNKRYSRLTLNFSGTHGVGTATAACAIHGATKSAPAA
jgi:uncharacterized protein involved in tellurium resistance